MSLDKLLKHRIWPASGQLLTSFFILLGLPLLAWGLDNFAGFFSNPVRTSYAIVVAAQALIQAWLVYRTPPHREHEHRFDLARWHSYMFELIFILSAYGDRRNALTWGENMPLRWAGLGIYLLGAILAIWAHFTWVDHLRKEGALAFDNPVLLFHGPFKWIRYPSLLYLFFYCLGIAILFRSWIGLVLMIALIAAILHRIHDLEKIFAEQYKKVWPLRCHNSKRIIPFVY